MKSIAALGAVLLGLPALAQHDHAQHAAAREWTRLPVLTPAMSRGSERGAAALKLSGIDAAEVTVFAVGGPGERRRVAYPVGPEGAKIESASPKVGNYHWVIARQESDTEVRIASTAWYFSNPGPAATELLKQPKHELELVPQPLPREHSGYRESEQWRVLVRWNGAPLANQAVTLETEFGSRSSYVSDAQGMVVVLFPRDFREQKAKPGGEEHSMGPRRAKFVLGTEHEAEGKRYLTAFNYTYSPDPDRTRSIAWGAAFGVIGMVAALPLLRRRTAKTDFSENKNA
ncbi:MAG: hypothetical protein HZA64_13655 [Rhodocyclales bacterium]|nr:hypothetical protein [Rhodocyclales bacterium]